MKEISLVGTPEIPNQISSTESNSAFNLFQNFPNPFTSETTIQYQLPDESFVTLDIYNMAGERLQTITFDGTNTQGIRLSPGIYIYRIQTEEFTSSKRLIIQ